MSELKESKVLKRKCRFRAVEYAINKADPSIEKEFTEVFKKLEAKEEKSRKEATWQDGYCYFMNGDSFYVECIDGIPHQVFGRDIQFLDTKEFYEDI